VQLSLPIDLVVWTTGTQAWEWVRSLPCEQTPSGQLRLRSTLQLLDYPEVFALGDVAEAYDLSGNLLSPTAQVAFQQAKTVAANLTASLQRRSLKPFRYRHQGDMLTLGIGNAVVADSRLHLTGMLASLLRQWVYLTRLPTWRHRLHVLWHRFRVWLRHWVRSTVGNSRRDRAIPAAALMSARRSSHHPSTRK
jgi:NADH dehydrogenase